VKRLLTTQEVAELLGKSPWWIRENIEILGIPAIKVGRQWRYREDDIEGWLLLNQVASL
jgi:excisionase family DNA binding protein